MMNPDEIMRAYARKMIELLPENMKKNGQPGPNTSWMIWANAAAVAYVMWLQEQRNEP